MPLARLSHQSSVLTVAWKVWPTPLLTLQLVRPKLLMFAFPFCNQIKLVGDFTHLGPWPLFFSVKSISSILVFLELVLKFWSSEWIKKH